MTSGMNRKTACTRRPGGILSITALLCSAALVAGLATGASAQSIGLGGLGEISVDRESGISAGVGVGGISAGASVGGDSVASVGVSIG